VDTERNCGENGGITNRTAETETDIAIITEKNEEKQRIRRHRQPCNDLLWRTSQQMGIIWSGNWS
jgi:hypothetical protein